MARFSKRSFAAVAAFMTTGIFSASGCSPSCPGYKFLRSGVDAIQDAYPTDTTTFVGSMITAVAVGTAIPAFLRQLPKPEENTEENKRTEIDETTNDYRKLIPSALSAA
eukprot:4889980-Ditylum_brightwellii.AAC.1